MLFRKHPSNSQLGESDQGYCCNPNWTDEGLQLVLGWNKPNWWCDIIFVHGLAGHAWSTWHLENRCDGKCLKFWPAWLWKDLKNDGLDVRIWTFGYKAARSNLTGSAMPLFDQASNLLKNLQIQNIGERPLFFITHSMGGLLVKKTLRNANDVINSNSIYKDFYSQLIDKTKGIVFLSTPHTGSHLADLIDNISALTQTTVNVQELRDNAAHLRELNEWYRDNVVGLGIATEVYYEQKTILRTLVVNPDSANPGIPGVKPTGLAEDHNSIAKPKSRTATMYGGVKLFIKILLKQTLQDNQAEQAYTTGLPIPDPTSVTSELNDTLAATVKVQGAICKAQAIFVLRGTIDLDDENTLKAITASLQKIARDADLTILKIEKGSIRLTLAGSQEGLERLKALFELGELTEVLGFPIEDVSIIASESAYNNVLKVWNLETRQSHILIGHSAPVTALAVSPDGRLVISGSDDATLKVWNLETGQLLRTFAGHSAPVTALAVSPDGRRVISGSDDTTLKVWDLEGQLMCNIHHKAPVTVLAVSPDGYLVISGSDDTTFKVWDLATGQLLRTFAGHSAPVTALAVSPDGRLVISGSDDTTLKVWDLATGQLLRTFAGHSAPVTALAVSPDGRLVISGSDDATLKVWDLATGQLLRTFAGHSAPVTALAVSPDGRLVISGSDDTTLTVWDLLSGNELYTLASHITPIKVLAVTPDGKGLIFC